MKRKKRRKRKSVYTFDINKTYPYEKEFPWGAIGWMLFISLLLIFIFYDGKDNYTDDCYKKNSIFKVRLEKCKYE